MRITVVGAGNAGTTIAADLALKGHEVKLLKTSKSLHNENFNKIMSNGFEIILTEKDTSRKAKLKLATTDFEEALVDSELVILYVQTNYQEEVIKKMSKYLTNQMVLIEPGYLATAFFLKYCKGKELVLIEAESSPIDCRIMEPASVNILFKNVKNPIGVYPKGKTKETLEKLKVLDYNFVATKNVIEAALHNPNLIVHTIGAFMSIPRIEYVNGHDYWMYREVFTKSVWNMVKKLDSEKMDIMEALNCQRISYPEACKLRNSLDEERDPEEVFFDYAKNHSPSGPFISDSRYITEDVPEGLVLMEALGEALQIATPICSSIINLSSACLNKDFRAEGRTLKRLGKEFVDLILKEEL